jgi:hypothetical protein
MAQRRKLSSKVPTIDLTNEEPFALLGNDIIKEIAKNLGPFDLARLGIADRRLRDVSSIQMAEILADPKLIKLAQKYKARLLRPHVHVSDGGPSLFKFPVSDVIRKGPDFSEEYHHGSREEALIGRAYDSIESFTKNRYDLVPFDVHDDDLYMFPLAEPLPGLMYYRDQIGREITRQ